MPMSIDTPEDLGNAYQIAFNAGRIDEIMALYDEDAVLVPAPGARVVGFLAIREAQLVSLGMGGTISMKFKYCIRSGDIALLQHEWSWTGAMWEDKPTNFSSRTAEVARRRPDGSWRYVIDHIWQND
jgi:ketosteroid isomerase-like protein